MGRIFGREEHLWRIYKEKVKRMREKKQEEEGRGIKKREKEFQEGEDSGKLEEEKRRPTSGHSEIVSADGQIDSRRAPGGPCQCRGHLHSRHRLWVIGGVLPRLAPPPQGGWRT